MKVTLVPGNEINAELIDAWVKLQQKNPNLASPFFHPEFTRVIASVRNDVEVAIVEDGGQVVAFFPFQRGSGSIGQPVGGVISDYQGLICAQDFACDPRELLKACGLVAWDFDHVIASQAFFAPFHRYHEPSPQLDLQHGFDAYVKERRAAGSEQIKKCTNAMRRLEREVGPLRFVSHANDSDSLYQTLFWKSQQYLRSDEPDLFAISWVRGAIERIQLSQYPGCAGMLSLLFSGDRLVAGHLGMRTHAVWHYWFPAYDPTMAIYSPGIILLLKIAEHAAVIGVRKIDLGKGLNLYKARLMNGSVPLAAGSVELPSWRAFRRHAKSKLRSLILNAPLREPMRGAVYCLRRAFGTWPPKGGRKRLRNDYSR
jgi:CelD/BcsL family acetyltransferase involved in cellulose biosynthesis